MPRRKIKSTGYGDTIGRFVRTYLRNVLPYLKKGDFESAALFLENLRGDYNSLGENREKAPKKVSKAYRRAMKYILPFLDDFSLEEAREFFSDERTKKTLLDKIKLQIRTIDSGMSKRKNESYETHRKCFERNLLGI